MSMLIVLLRYLVFSKTEQLRKIGKLLGPDVEYEVPADVVHALEKIVGKQRTKALPDLKDAFWDQVCVHIC